MDKSLPELDFIRESDEERERFQPHELTGWETVVFELGDETDE